MHSKYRIVIVCSLVGIVLFAGQAFASQALMPTRAASLGHWEIVREIEYDNIPKENLDGDLSPAYMRYMVSLAGFETETYGIAVGPDDDVRYTTDGGVRWTRATGELYCRHGLDMVDEQVAWHCGNGGTRVSTDSGQSWQTVTPSNCPLMSFLDAQTGWTASPFSLQATDNGGIHWDELALPSDQEIAAITLRTAQNGYLLDNAGNLYVTADGGQNWTTRSLGLAADETLLTGAATGPYAVMRFLDAQHGMVVFVLSDQTVWFAVTDDGGQSWQRAEIPELRGQSYYYHLFLSHDGRFLTVTDDFLRGENKSILLRYQAAS